MEHVKAAMAETDESVKDKLERGDAAFSADLLFELYSVPVVEKSNEQPT